MQAAKESPLAPGCTLLTLLFADMVNGRHLYWSLSGKFFEETPFFRDELDRCFLHCLSAGRLRLSSVALPLEAKILVCLRPAK
jgi:hypothetical protein